MMGAARKLSVVTDPAHEYVQKAIAEGRCRREELSIRRLIVDLEKFQARVNPYEMGHTQQLHQILKIQGWLAPIVVFEEIIGSKQYLRVADGFTRTKAYQNEKLPAIPAWVMPGGEQEATEFATMANQHNTCRKRQAEDAKRAVRLLVACESWRSMAASVIAKHVGVSPQIAIQERNAWFAEHGIEPPAEVVRSDGRVYPTRCSRGTVERRDVREEKRVGVSHVTYTTTINGKRVRLGRDKAKAEEKATKLWNDQSRKIAALQPDAFLSVLGRRGLKVARASNLNTGLGSAILYGTPPSAAIASGHARELNHVRELGSIAIFNRAAYCPSGRAIVVCYEPFECKALDIARQLGVEFLTPEELVESLRDRAD